MTISVGHFVKEPDIVCSQYLASQMITDMVSAEKQNYNNNNNNNNNNLICIAPECQRLQRRCSIILYSIQYRECKCIWMDLLQSLMYWVWLSDLDVVNIKLLSLLWFSSLYVLLFIWPCCRCWFLFGPPDTGFMCNQRKKERKSIYIVPFIVHILSKCSDMDHTFLPVNYTMPAFSL